MPLHNSNDPAILPEQLLRETLIDVARKGWINRLIDFSRRNNLLYYRPLQSGTLELQLSDELLSTLYRGDLLPLDPFIADDKIKANSVRQISRKALENSEEKGLATLYLALGKATWPADDGGRDPEAPVLLLPISFESKGQDISTVKIRANGDIQVNDVLLHVLKTQFDVEIDPQKLIGHAAGHNRGDALTANPSLNDSNGHLNLSAALDALTCETSSIKGFRAQPFSVIGNFSFQKLAMVNDLEKRRKELVGNDVVAAIAGDVNARKTLGSSKIETDPKTLDSILPDAEFQVVEADSSQQCAILGTVAGQSTVIHGPPGTGKSQTITNLIATLAATGKKVLFVAEKRAALEVVIGSGNSDPV